jgi:hypothetical protein
MNCLNVGVGQIPVGFLLCESPAIIIATQTIRFPAQAGASSFWRPSARQLTTARSALDPDRLERLGRYEVHLDRKLERMLAMLLRLKDLWQGAIRT